MRGEKATCEFELGNSIGSSPHARGKVLSPFRLLLFPGIIPACAGKST